MPYQRRTPTLFQLTALVLFMLPLELLAQSGSSLIVRGGVARTNSYTGGGPESGLTLGISVGHQFLSFIGLELGAGTSALPMSEIVPTCSPSLSTMECRSEVMAPGTLAFGSLSLTVRPDRRLTLFAGGSSIHSMDFPKAENTRSNGSSTGVHAGLRLTPFGSSGRGPGLEMIATRFSREIGSVRWMVTPSLVWRF